jgi:hypothetical protein
MTLDDHLRRLVREELALLLAEDDVREAARPLTDLDRQRARSALTRLGLLGTPRAKARSVPK